MIDDRKPDFVLYQSRPEGTGIGEEALMLKKYHGTFEIAGKDNEIIINYETIPELIRVLKQIQNDPHPRNK